jgi:hypothetical protein
MLCGLTQETLRLKPPVGVGQIRVSLKEDLVLCNGNLKLPRGTFVWVPHTAIQTCNHNWDEPLKFMPGTLRPRCITPLKGVSSWRSHCHMKPRPALVCWVHNCETSLLHWPSLLLSMWSSRSPCTCQRVTSWECSSKQVSCDAERWADSNAEFVQKPSLLPKEWQVEPPIDDEAGRF